MERQKFDGEVVNVKVSLIETKFDERDGAKKIIITADNGQKYRFKEKKKDGGVTSAYKTFETGIVVGDVLEVGYKKVENDFEGKKYSNNYISFMKKVNPDGNYDKVEHLETPPGMEEIPF